MSTNKAQNTIQAAVELGFLTPAQLENIEKEQAKSRAPWTNIAIQRGFLNRQQLDILDVFACPLDVVPGYRIDGLIGQGGAGVVYKATQVRLDRPVAIKTVKQASLRNETTSKRFEREAQIVGQLRHPNIVSAFDFGVHAGQLYLVMEYIDGIDAGEYLDRNGKLPEDHAWHIGLQMAHALDYSNQNGITHRDIKPANLVLTAPPIGTNLPPSVPFVKIADFGLARFGENHASPAITVEGSISGTPYYMPPEQITSSQADHLSDIYAMGITLWHLITGQVPFSGDAPMAVMTSKLKIGDEWLDPPPVNMSPAGFELLKKMSRHRREDRISSYRQLISEIEAVVSNFQTCQVDGTEENHQQFSASPSVTFFDSLSGYDATGDANTAFLGDLDVMNQGSADDQAAAVSNAPATKRWTIWAVGAAVVVAGVWALLGHFLDQEPTTAKTANRPETRTRLDSFAGPPIFLFNGTEVDPRQKFSGLWEPAQGGEGERVLAGKNGTRDFACVDENDTPLKWFRFSCGFRHHESNRIDFRWLDTNQNEAFRAVITPDESKLVVHESEIAKLELEKFSEDSFGYHLFQIESQPDHWRVMVNSQLLGLVDKSALADGGVPVIQLQVEGSGSGHFEQIRLFRFTDE